MKKKLIGFLTATVAVLSAAGFAACAQKETAVSETTPYQEMYAMYVAYAQEAGTPVQAYEQWLATIKGEKGEPGKDGQDGKDGKDGVGIADAFIDEQGNFIVVLTNGKEINCGNVACNCTPPTETPPEETGTDGLEYTLSDDETYYIASGIGSATDTDIVIASTYNDLPVTSIGYRAFADCYELTSVVIPEGVTTIKTAAFSSCWKMQNITIPNSVKAIGISAFASCWELTSVTIPDGVTSIEGTLFSGCQKLTSVTIPNSVTSIGSGAFSLCSNLTNVTIPDSVVTIFSGAFQGCDGLIQEENGISYVDNWAVGCTHSTNEVAFRTGTKGIARNALEGCSHLTSVSIPNSVIYVCFEAFKGCSGLIEEEGGVYYVDRWVIDCDSYISAATLRADTKGIADSAFSLCYYLKDLVLSQNLVSIGDQAFYECSALTSIQLPAEMVYIAQYAFYACHSLTSVYYSGTESEWSDIKIGTNDILISATRYYYSESQPTESGNYWHYDTDGNPVVW